jgi:hypothetical protein
VATLIPRHAQPLHHVLGPAAQEADSGGLTTIESY